MLILNVYNLYKFNLYKLYLYIIKFKKLSYFTYKWFLNNIFLGLFGKINQLLKNKFNIFFKFNILFNNFKNKKRNKFNVFINIFNKIYIK